VVSSRGRAQSTVSTAELETALERRLGAVVPHLVAPTDRDRVRALPVGPLLDALGAAVAESGDDAAVWLLCVAVAGGFPTRVEMQLARRGLGLARADERIPAILSAVALTASEALGRHDDLEIVERAVVCDVDFCARMDHNTGIQRVVRQTMPHWARDHQPVLAAWTDFGLGYRRLSARETSRVLEWSRRGDPAVATLDSTITRTLLVPWQSTVVLPEVPSRELIDRLATLAQYSGNDVSLIGYDAIPIVSADSMTNTESDRFALYLSIVKHAQRVAGISESAAAEFAGFCTSLPTQGLIGPRVSSVTLPVELPTTSQKGVDVAAPTGRASVLMVGSLEPRKNQAAVIHASELLWREGIDFELDIIGGGSAWYLAAFLKTVRALQKKGRPLSVRSGIGDVELRDSYRRAAFIVFPSLHEGYGLPVAEALASGKPVITSNYGSTAEIARAGGCLLVDPRDDLDIAAAMRRLLTEPGLREQLVAETALRTDRGWKDYANELWADLVVGTRGVA
jgi:glycosyltransferase involved in cell wall biosynthesis